MDAATVIRILHIAFIAFMVYAPFSGVDEFLVMHAVLVPFLLLHWLTNSDACALTLLEKKLRGIKNDSESFIHNLVAPIYVIDDCTLRDITTVGTLMLWMVTLRQLTFDKFKRVVLKR